MKKNIFLAMATSAMMLTTSCSDSGGILYFGGNPGRSPYVGLFTFALARLGWYCIQ